MSDRTFGLDDNPFETSHALTYAEVIVNVPIRRTFGRAQESPPPADLPTNERNLVWVMFAMAETLSLIHI